MTPAVSVVVPVFNAAAFLEETVASVRAQTRPDYELLLCDDGSTDTSLEIARRLAARDPERIRVLTHPGRANRGPFATRLLGARHARADLLAFLDSDDLWEPDYLEAHLAWWDSVGDRRPGMSYGPALYWHADRGGARDFVQRVPRPGVYEPGELLEWFLSTGYGITPCPSAVLLAREVLEGLDGLADAAREVGPFEDQILSWWIAASRRVAVHERVGVRYRQHAASSVARLGRSARARRMEARFLEIIEPVVAARHPGHPLLAGGRLAQRRSVLLRPVSPAERLREAAADRVSPRLYQAAARLYHGLRRRLLRLPGVRHLAMARLRRLTPLHHGRLRGTPVVRYYWERFLEERRDAFRGAGLEIGTVETLERMDAGLTSRDALDVSRHGPDVTVVADLSRADSLPAEAYDCLVVPFTFQFIYDVEAALYHAVRILRPGGRLLANFPCTDYYFPAGLEMFTGRPIYLHHWFTPLAVENLLRRVGLVSGDFTVEVYGNLLARVAYEMNVPAEELTARELAHRDPGHPLLICVDVRRPAAWRAEPPAYRDPWLPAGRPLVWNPVTGHYPLEPRSGADA